MSTRAARRLLDRCGPRQPSVSSRGSTERLAGTAGVTRLDSPRIKPGSPPTGPLRRWSLLTHVSVENAASPMVPNRTIAIRYGPSVARAVARCPATSTMTVTVLASSLSTREWLNSRAPLSCATCAASTAPAVVAASAAASAAFWARPAWAKPTASRATPSARAISSDTAKSASITPCPESACRESRQDPMLYLRAPNRHTDGQRPRSAHEAQEARFTLRYPRPRSVPLRQRFGLRRGSSRERPWHLCLVS